MVNVKFRFIVVLYRREGVKGQESGGKKKKKTNQGGIGSTKQDSVTGTVNSAIDAASPKNGMQWKI